MRGKPKYKYGDIVRFQVDDEIKEGIVAIIDRYGTFFDDSDVSYDLLNKEENMLYKHFGEKLIIEKIGETDPNTIWNDT